MWVEWKKRKIESHPRASPSARTCTAHTVYTRAYRCTRRASVTARTHARTQVFSASRAATFDSLSPLRFFSSLFPGRHTLAETSPVYPAQSVPCARVRRERAVPPASGSVKLCLLENLSPVRGYSCIRGTFMPRNLVYCVPAICYLGFYTCNLFALVQIHPPMRDKASFCFQGEESFHFALVLGKRQRRGVKATR